ncbi:MAG: hypothetical protein H6839_02240 [Planctomycetes bacterium]|nr:hypothetical protein [Planctomycetota bacterium]
MPAPVVEVIGVYRVTANDATVVEALELQRDLSPTDPGADEAAQEIRREIESTVLIEMLIDDGGSLEELPVIRQSLGSAPSDNDQVCYLERYLSSDGTRVLSDSRLQHDGGKVRVTFFIHYYKPDVALAWEFGPITCTPPRSMPKRLARLCPYEPVD